MGGKYTYAPGFAMTNITWSCWNGETITNGSSGCMGVWDSCRALFHKYLDDCAVLEETETNRSSNMSEDLHDNASNNTSKDRRGNTSNNTYDDRRERKQSPEHHTAEDRSVMTKDFQDFLCHVDDYCWDCPDPLSRLLAASSSSAGGAWGASSSSLGV